MLHQLRYAVSKIRLINLVYWVSILMADAAVYLFLGVLQMDDDDNWDASKGLYGSFSSRSNWQLIYYLALQVWNIINLIALIYVVVQVVKQYRKINKQVNY